MNNQTELKSLPNNYLGINKELLIDEIKAGDLVDFGIYGKLYIADITSYKRLFWVTPDRSDRFNRNCAGQSLEKKFAMKIIEKGETCQMNNQKI